MWQLEKGTIEANTKLLIATEVEDESECKPDTMVLPLFPALGTWETEVRIESLKLILASKTFMLINKTHKT